MDLYIKSYLAYLSSRKNYSTNTIYAYKHDLEDFLNYLDKIHIKDLNQATIASLQDYMASINVSNSTYNRKITSIKGYYCYQLKRNNNIKINIEDIEHVKKEKIYPHTLRKDEIREIIKCIDNNVIGIRDKSIIMFLYISGLRVSELINLTFTDINFQEGYIRCIGKGNKEKIIVVGDLLNISLSNYLKNSRNIILRGIKCNYIYCNEDGEKLSRQTINNLIKKYAKKANIKRNVSPHTFRHCFATHMMENGADIRSVQEMLGHSDISTTQIYTNITNQTIKNEYFSKIKDPFHLITNKEDK